MAATPREERSKIKSDILLRVRMLYLLFFLAGIVILSRLVWVQAFSRETEINAGRIEKRIFREEVVTARRGSILARGGEPLATSLFRYRVAFDFSAEGLDSLALFEEQSDSLAKLLSLYFKDRTAEQYRAFFRREHARHYRTVFRKDTVVYNSEGWFGRFWDRLRGEETSKIKLYDTIRDPRPVDILPREVDYAEWQTLKEYPMLNWNMGMVYTLEKHDRRVYPQGELARRTIGLVGDRGEYGIEAIWREALTGRDGREVRQRIARGFSGRVAGHEDNVEATDGADIVTTLDLDVQDIADKALRRQLERQNALWGTTVVMECGTGDILAMVNLGRRDDGTYGEKENYALSRRMEPGSTFKAAALLALIEDRGADLSLTYDSGDGKPVMVGRAKVQDSHAGFSAVDLKTATAQSLNVFFAKAVYEAYREEPQRYVDFLKHLHLDRPMGLEAYGERTPLLPEPGQKIWYPHVTLPNLGYGYAIELAPIQVLTLYNAIANEGRMVAPRLIREIRRGEKVVERMKTEVLVDRICSQSTLRKVRECLEEVALTGTAKYYFGDTARFRVGAKTGTAKFAQGDIHYSDGYYLGSMVTYLPADKPRYTLLPSIFPRRGYGTTYYGAGLAGPVQRQVAACLAARDPVRRVPEPERQAVPARLKGGDATQVRKVASRYDIPLRCEIRQGWGRIAGDSTGLTLRAVDDRPDRVPDVRGMGLKDALYLLESRGLRVRFSGKGAVAAQTPAAGTPCKRGETVSVTLR